MSGRLPNGLTYHVVQGGPPDQKISMQLVVKFGDLDAMPKEQQVGHLIEHIVFENARDARTGQTIYERVAAMGGLRGADVNAVTGGDRTLFFLKIPPADPQALETGLDIMHGWARPFEISDAAIERASQAVMAETARSSSRAAAEAMQLAWFDGHPLLGRPSDPPGTIAVTGQTIRSMHSNFYRPGNMAVIIYGPLDAKSAAARIEALLADIPARAGVVPSRRWSAPKPSGGHYIVLPGNGSAEASIRVTHKYYLAGDTVSRARAQAAELIGNRLFADAFGKFSQSDGAAVIYSGTHLRLPQQPGSLMGLEIADTGLEIRPARLREAMAQLFEVYAAVRRRGFETAHVERARADVLASLDAAPLRAEEVAEGYSAAFASGSAPPDRLAVRAAVGKLGVRDINALYRAWLDPRHRDILLVLPDPAAAPSRDEIDRLMAKAESGPLASLAPAPVVAPDLVRLDAVAVPSASASLREVDGLWIGRLPGSGATFLYRRRAGDQLMIHASRRGGSTRFGARQAEAREAVEYIGRSGIGGIDHFQLAAFFAREQIDVRPTISLFREGISAQGLASRLGLMTRLMRTYLLAPQCDPAALAALRSEREEGERRIDVTLSARAAHNALVDENLSEMASVIPSKAASAADLCGTYRQVLGGMQGMVIAIEGPLPPEEIWKIVVPSLDIGIGSGRAEIPAITVRETTGRKRTIETGSYAMAQVSIVLKRSMPISPSNEPMAAIVAQILQERLTDRLRGIEQGVYSVAASAEVRAWPDHLYLRIDFDARPADVPRLVAAAQDELRRLSHDGASASEIAAAIMVVSARPDQLHLIAERYLSYGAIVRSPPPDDAAVNAWLRQYLDAAPFDEYVRLPAKERSSPPRQ
ncbi:M16 family metallopeptidase [Sphingopyxis sp. YR583]|uniref:M16 family metallopeptidase n=1 Tax=Sphingopyxis sp. YR583 TaxID=1881047 RepID=UPI00115FB3C5|nr:insulinase family protein [Sphingopyxis sp. YR583]